jgi:soluble lytic murein transglycosylase
MRVAVGVVCCSVLALVAGMPAVGAPLPRWVPAVSDGVAAASYVEMVGGVPLPPRRPGRATIVGRVQAGQAVPLSPMAFAERAAGPVAILFGAADAASAGSAPPAEPLPAPVTAVAAPAAPPAAAPLLAGHGGAGFEAAPSRPGALKAALDALKADRYREAIERRNGLKDPVDRMIVDYFLMRSGTDQLTSGMLADYARRAAGWPDEGLVRTRAEEALARERPQPDVVIRSMGGTARSDAGLRLLANAHLAKGDRGTALTLVRSAWHGRSMGTAMQAAYVKDFGALLTVDDHLTRIDKLIALGKFDEARALRERLGAGPRAYLAARIAAGDGQDAAKLLAAVPAELKRRPGHRLAEIEALRHRERWDEAASLIEKQPAKGLVDGDPWWVETRIVARILAERGDVRRAYRLASRGYAESAEERADEAFHAGWFALRAGDARAAESHFQALGAMATTPITRSRASYWAGRAAEKRGDRGAARRHYEMAARSGFTFYGQLAREELGTSGTGEARAPDVTNADRVAFAKNPVAEAVRRVVRDGHDQRVWPLLDHLSETVPTAGQVALTVELAREAGYPHLALMVAKEGQRRGLAVGRLAYPTTEIPKSAKIPTGLDPAVVFAITRQESLFNAGAVSPVGARGLMQVMPQTGAAMARELGLSHSPAKLNEPSYNATIGSAYLKKRLGEFNGSYILTFAAYNAGASKVREWIVRFGDPRDPSVDPIEWVESIPYPETRNYVQRVMENVQVYREALGSGRLAIREDLGRGRSS